MNTFTSTQHNQSGMAILMAIIFLLVLTVVGITSTNSSILSEKMSYNMKDMVSAFQAAESALSDGEEWLQKSTSAPSTCSSAPCTVWQSNIISSPETQTTNWWQTNGQTYSSTIQNVYTQPMYLIEQYSFSSDDLSPESLAAGKGFYYYRITARGVGSTSNATVNLQSIYAIRFN